jgi:hypothetical protein
MRITLATTYHDKRDRLYDQIAKVLPTLTELFDGIAIQASVEAPERSLALLSARGASIRRNDPSQPGSVSMLGRVRRNAVTLALQHDTPLILFFDFDSLLHWAEHYRDELMGILPRLAPYDMTVIGRTQRALDTFPRGQRATEDLVNELFARVSSHSWDVMRSGRGLSRHAAETIVGGCLDDHISTDVSWPLFLLRQGGFTFNEIAVEGTEFETANRYEPEIAASGGYKQWLEQLDSDPQHWAHRFNLARMHAEAMSFWRS